MNFNKRKIIVVVVLFTILMMPFSLFAQKKKRLIEKRFDKIEYYANSTIKCAYKVRNEKNHGYCIEFDSLGNPKKIGKYKNGLKHGNWYLENGWITEYKNGEIGLTLIPGCGTGKLDAIQNFNELFENLIKKK